MPTHKTPLMIEKEEQQGAPIERWLPGMIEAKGLSGAAHALGICRRGLRTWMLMLDFHYQRQVLSRETILATNYHPATRTPPPPRVLNRSEWEAMKAAYKFQCAYCGEKSQRLTQDHVVPWHKGGRTTVDNIVPACKSCNSKKRTGPPPPFQRLLFLSKEGE